VFYLSYICIKKDMVEVVKHLFGFCGEAHPNVIYLFGLTHFVVIVRTYMLATYELTVYNLKIHLQKVLKFVRHD
jgi:hypothetical protein